MKDILHEEKRHGLTIKIFHDQDADGPEAWGDDNLFLVGYHRNFSVDGPKDKRGYLIVTKNTALEIAGHDFCPPKAKANSDTWDTAAELGAQYHFFGLEAYIHSGVRLALMNEGRFPDRCWDVSLLGLVAVSKKEWRTRDKARKAALGLIESWNDYLSGNIYGYVIEDQEGNDLESCWGFYGDYDKDCGALIEARGIVDHITNKGLTDPNGQMLMAFMAN